MHEVVRTLREMYIKLRSDSLRDPDKSTQSTLRAELTIGWMLDVANAEDA
jgi:hypothetical protein